MNRFKRYFGHGFRNTSHCKAKSHEVTRSGLAYTPADMERMVANGIPVQSQELATRFYDGKPDADFSDITSDRLKENDLNDLWEEHQRINKKMSKVRSKAKKSDKPKSE